VQLDRHASTVLILALVGLPVRASRAPEYDRYKLFELVACADLVVAGQIVDLDEETFELRAERWIVGDAGGPGDVDGDGIVDLVALGSDRLWCLFLHRDGSVRSHREIRVSEAPRGNAFLACSPAVGPRRTRLALVCPGESDATVFFLHLERDGTPVSR
jgi:hypothetical protein